jgi:hypothetical protein
MSIDNTILEFKLPTTTTPSNILLTNIISSSNLTSCIKVNIKELNLKIYNEIIISWNIINEDTTISDWIGIYKSNGLYSTNSKKLILF